jgi:hypothetical protein
VIVKIGGAKDLNAAPIPIKTAVTIIDTNLVFFCPVTSSFISSILICLLINKLRFKNKQARR